MSWHILKVTLAHIRPPIWRRLCVPSDTPLDVLHLALQAAFGWQDSHEHEFRVGRARYGVPDPDANKLRDEAEMTVAEALPHKSSSAQYTYDLADCWLHTISVERIEAEAPSQGGRSLRPRRKRNAVTCLDGARAAPPEDCGGPASYDDFLRALAHPNHVRHAEMSEWSRGIFDPEQFDAAFVNRRLAALA